MAATGAGSTRGATEGSTTANPGATAGGSDWPFVASASVARRLSKVELDNTLGTLLLDETAPAHELLSEDEFSPYDNDYTLQLASSALIESLELLAEDVGARAIASDAFKSRVLPCTPDGPDDAECFRSVAETLLQKAFRRPVADEEVTPYLALLDFASERVPGQTTDFYTAVELLIRAIVQDPEFLYRVEVGTPTAYSDVVALTGYEIATRMSYLLWGDMPDDALFSEASAGTLAASAERRASAERMLQSTKSKAQLERFHAMWLGYRAIPQSEKLTTAFARETNALIDRVLFDEPQSYLNLFTFDETYLDTDLAAHYGLPAPVGGEGWVSYGDSGRAGILSHGSVLSAFGKFSDTSPTQRGILVRTRLMCEPVPSPPANVNTDQPPSDTDATCKIDRYEEHRSNGACAGCHNALDPIGFGLESFDMAGRFRDHEEGLVECSIDGRGMVEPYGEFSGPAELEQILVDQGEIDDCVVRQYLSFALGRPLDENEATLADDLLERFRGSGHTFTELLLDYIGSEAFGLRLVPEQP